MFSLSAALEKCNSSASTIAACNNRISGKTITILQDGESGKDSVHCPRIRRIQAPNVKKLYARKHLICIGFDSAGKPSSFLVGMTAAKTFIGRTRFYERISRVENTRDSLAKRGPDDVRREEATTERRSARRTPDNRPRTIARQPAGGGDPEGSPENVAETCPSRRN